MDPMKSSGILGRSKSVPEFYLDFGRLRERTSHLRHVSERDFSVYYLIAKRCASLRSAHPTACCVNSATHGYPFVRAARRSTSPVAGNSSIVYHKLLFFPRLAANLVLWHFLNRNLRGQAKQMHPMFRSQSKRHGPTPGGYK